MAKKISDEDPHQIWKAALPGTILSLPGDRSIPLQELKEGIASGFGGIPMVLSMVAASGQWQELIQGLPPNRGKNGYSVDDVLKTMFASVLAGGSRYRHVEHMLRDKLLAEMINADLCTDESLNRAIARMAAQGAQSHVDMMLRRSALPTLRFMPGWHLALDPTIKTVYGHQEGAEVGYNPHKKGHRGYALHIATVSGARLVLQCTVKPGNLTSPVNALDSTLDLIDWTRSEDVAPGLVLGDVAFGNDTVMKPLEERNIPYLFRLKRSKGVDTLCRRALEQRILLQVQWKDCGKGYKGCSARLQLQGWDAQRWVIILARPIRRPKPCLPALPDKQAPPTSGEAQLLPPQKKRGRPVKAPPGPKQAVFDFSWNAESNTFQVKGSMVKRAATMTPPPPAAEAKSASTAIGSPAPAQIVEDPDDYEFMVLVTSLPEDTPIEVIAQYYRQRSDCENPNDQLKNQQSLGGFTSHKMEKTALTASLSCLFHNYWILFARCVEPEQTTEQITGRPALIQMPILMTTKNNESTLRLGPVGNHPHLMLGLIMAIALFSNLNKPMTQSVAVDGIHKNTYRSSQEKWTAICAHAWRKYLPGPSGAGSGDRSTPSRGPAPPLPG